MEEANTKGFDAVYALRKEFVPAECTESERRDLNEIALNIYLPWCKQSAHAESASKLVAGLAIAVAGHDLAAGHDPVRAVDVLMKVWPFLDRIDYRACEFALTLAEARRAAADYAGVEQALVQFDALRTQAAWRNWLKSDTYGPRLPIHELVHECRRAMLELDLGNPDGAVHRLHAAADLQAKRPAELPKGEPVSDAWNAAEVEFYRTRIDCHFALGCFGPASAAANEVLGRDDLRAYHPMFELYGALAEYWNRATPEATAKARRVVKRFARHENPDWRRVAQICLLEGAVAAPERNDSDADLVGWFEELTARLDPHAATLQTAWLLRGKPTPSAEQLTAQAAAQARAWRRVAASWASTPVRDGGVGFLHYLDRRDDLAQLVAITLRAGECDGVPSADAVAKALGFVMEAQTFGALPRALHTTVPTAKQVQASLHPDHAVVLFLPASTGTHVFAVTANDIEHHLLNANALSLRGTVQAYVDLVQSATNRVDIQPAESARLATDLRSAGQGIVRTLFPPALVARMAKWRALTVVGAELLHGPISGRADAGFLNYLPLECLPWNDEDLFGQRFAIDHNASLPVWLQLAARAGIAGRDTELRVFGVLGRGEGALAPLATPFAATRQYLDDRCTLARVQDERAVPGARPAARRSRVAVFVGHGGYDAASERGSWLQLYDLRLTCALAQALGSPDSPFADIVVLAACRAARGPNRLGDSLANLGGAFQLAGATAVVQSRFDLPLRATRALLDEFVRDLAAGTPCAEAMRRARALQQASPLDAYRACVLQVHGYGQRRAGP